MQDKIAGFLNEPLAQKLLFFNELLTPSLVRLAYWLCLLAIAWTGLGHMFSGGFGNFLEGIAYIATWAILARIGAELVIVLFKLHEKMDEVARNTRAAKMPTETPSATAETSESKTAKTESPKKIVRKTANKKRKKAAKKTS